MPTTHPLDVRPFDLGGDFVVTEEHLRHIRRHGYVVLRQCCPPVLAKRVYNLAIREFKKQHAAGTWNAGFNFPSVGTSADAWALVKNKRVFGALEAVLGAGNVELPPKGCLKCVQRRLLQFGRENALKLQAEWEAAKKLKEARQRKQMESGEELRIDPTCGEGRAKSAFLKVHGTTAGAELWAQAVPFEPSSVDTMMSSSAALPRSAAAAAAGALSNSVQQVPLTESTTLLPSVSSSDGGTQSQSVDDSASNSVDHAEADTAAGESRTSEPMKQPPLSDRTLPGEADLKIWREYWHIDGGGTAKFNYLHARTGQLDYAGGVRLPLLPTPRKTSRAGGSIGAFSLLCGVFLHDIMKDWRGSLTVWPGTHHAVFAAIQERGLAHFSEHGLTFEELESFADAQRLKEKEGTSALPDGAFPSPEPVQLKVRRGDVVLAHPLLPHAAGWNFRDPRGRFAIYFRVRHRQHAELGKHVLHDNLFAEVAAELPQR